MNSPIVMQALNIGLNVGRIRQAVLDKLQKTGSFFSSADALIEATLNIQYDEDQDHQGGDVEDNNSAASRQVKQILNDFVEQCTNNIESDKTTSSSLSSITSPSTSSSSTSSSSNKTVVSLEEENRLLKEARLCKICMDNEVGIVFLPCGHLTVCVNCAPNLTDCPVCRSAIKATVRTFLS